MTHPIDLYVEAKEELAKGDKAAAAQKLAEAMGEAKPTTVIEDNVERLVRPGCLAHEVALGLVTHHAKEVTRG